jgi:hypothetical protein
MLAGPERAVRHALITIERLHLERPTRTIIEGGA